MHFVRSWLFSKYFSAYKKIVYGSNASILETSFRTVGQFIWICDQLRRWFFFVCHRNHYFLLSFFFLFWPFLHSQGSTENTRRCRCKNKTEFWPKKLHRRKCQSQGPIYENVIENGLLFYMKWNEMNWIGTYTYMVTLFKILKYFNWKT